MNAVLRGVYEVAGQVARTLAAVAPPSDAKLIATFRARRGIRERYSQWGIEQRRAQQPLLWMHASSVGEGLMALPIIQALRRAHADTQIAYTHFSPSAVDFARSIGADFTDYLPFDTASDAETALDALRPRALVFSKLDVWPILASRASDRGTRLGLVSATLPIQSGRRSVVARAFLRDAYARLDAVGAVDAADAERLTALGVRPEVISVTGDTRYDQVLERVAATDRRGPVLAPLANDRPTLVAGSTWPADERHLLPALEAAVRQEPALRVIIAPHEPRLSHLEPIERWAASAQLRVARLGDPRARDADVILVDRVGVLAELYALADFAFVGGGFHSHGLHSVIEPAACGVPVLFGPRYAASRDAEKLVEAGAAVSVPDADALERTIVGWIREGGERHAAGEHGRIIASTGRGAAARTLSLVLALLA